uniref:Cytochrome c oxidase subunit 3 n=1 Tax=Neoseiulus womersleyi TaxID=322050 RepID=A0A8F6U2S4_9ACAR|nr:cytochrome c oxidase subunit 3 [Neoseiulus womersleyi]
MPNKHSFHIVDLSPWPLLSSFSLMNLIMNSMIYFKYPNQFNINFMNISLMLLMMCITLWWRDTNRESTFQGHHTWNVLTGLKISMMLFITSEVMFFLSMFWSYFHFSLAPDWEISNVWPPLGIMMINPYEIPLLNTTLLLSSGATVTWCHYSILKKNYNNSLLALALTLILGGVFTSLQIMEYKFMPFSINDSTFGSIFFMCTGFHGFHVIIGSLFLLVNFFRLYKNFLNNMHHFSFEAASWYWHFVDVVWIYLYTFMYWWFF